MGQGGQCERRICLVAVNKLLGCPVNETERLRSGCRKLTFGGDQVSFELFIVVAVQPAVP